MNVDDLLSIHSQYKKHTLYSIKYNGLCTLDMRCWQLYWCLDHPLPVSLWVWQVETKSSVSRVRYAHWNVLLLSLVKARIQKHCSIIFILRQSMRRQFGLLAVSGVTASGTVGCAIPRCCRHCSRPQRRRKLVKNQPQCSQPGPDNHIVLSSDRFDQLPDTKRELEDENELGSDLAKYSCTQLFSAPLVFFTFFFVIFLLW